MNHREKIAHLLAHVLVDSRWNRTALFERFDAVFGKAFQWCGPFVDRLLAQFPAPPTSALLEAFILSDEGFSRARFRRLPAYWPIATNDEMRSALPCAIDVPSLCNTRQLADWLKLRISELDWFADLNCFSRNAAAGKLCHYRYRVVAKRFGAIRLIESPKARLKEIQRQLLRQVLDRVNPHDAAHGFRRGRSIATFAEPHVGQAVVARMDLADFFPCVHRAKAAALFRTIGYPKKVAELLGGLCTTVTPTHAWTDCDASGSRESLLSVRRMYGIPHLPQGSPTSPAIANLCAYRLDCRLAGLATSVGACYTRYADDLAFSGDAHFARRVKRFMVHVTATVAEEGFVVHHRKTRIMREGVRQHLAGVVVNHRINIWRVEYDRLKAILTNCRRYGAVSQNRHSHPDFLAHLGGRVAFVQQINPDRGRRLRELLSAIPRDK